MSSTSSNTREPMKTNYLIIAIVVVLGLVLILWLAMRSPTVRSEAKGLRQDVRELGSDAEQGVRDAAEATRKAAEDAKNGIKDAVQ